MGFQISGSPLPKLQIVTLLASAARTATTTSADQSNTAGHLGVMITLNVTANPGGAESLSVRIEYKEPVSGTWNIAVIWNAAISATNGIRYLLCRPGATGVLNGGNTVAVQLATDWRVAIAHSAAGSWTYSVAAELLP